MPTSPVLRSQILQILNKHDRTTPNEYLPDSVLVLETRAELFVIQRELDILEHEGAVELAKSMGPRYAARLLPPGLLDIGY
jgi:hypothetical protein